MNENKTALVVDDDEDICTSIQERIRITLVISATPQTRFVRRKA